MPVISIFFGIIIRVFHDDHSPAHFHIEYAEHRAVMAIETGRLLVRKVPARVTRLVNEWRRLHLDELRRCWNDAQAGKQPKRVRPLA